MGQRIFECVLLIGTRSAQSIMASGLTAAQTGRTHDRTRPMLQQVRKFLPRRRRPHMDPSLPALPSCRSPPRRGPRRSRSQTFRTTTSVRLPRQLWEPNHWPYFSKVPLFLKFRFQRENAKRPRPRHGRKLKPNASFFSRTLNTLTLCRVPSTREETYF